MGMAAIMTQNGTGTTALWTPDWVQKPNNISIACIATGAPTFTVEYCYDSLTATAVVTSFTFFPSSINGTTISAEAAIDYPITGIRLNIATSSSTAFVTVIFRQATWWS